MKKYLNVIISVVILILEALPQGVVLRFANPEGEPFHNTFSYFDLTPFGYANFAPLLTVICTIILLIASILYCVKRRGIKLIKTLSVIGFVLTLIPSIMHGIEYLTWIAVVIAIMFLVEFAITITLKNKGE